MRGVGIVDRHQGPLVATRWLQGQNERPRSRTTGERSRGAPSR